MLQHQGKYEQAAEINQRTLTRREKALGVDHRDTLISVNNLALTLRYQREVRAGGRDEPTGHWCNLRRRRAQASQADIASTFIFGDLEHQRTQHELCGETFPTAKVS
jgi:hypothetical protein